MSEKMRWLNLLFKDSTGVPLAHRPFQLVFGDGDVAEGQTDRGGRLRWAVPAGVKKVTLFFIYRRFELELDSLPDVQEVKGLQERLNLLNYFAGPVDGDFGPRTRNALASFQRSYGLEETGEGDESTLRSLREVFGG